MLLTPPLLIVTTAWSTELDVPGMATVAYTIPPTDNSKLAALVPSFGRKSSRIVVVFVSKRHVVKVAPVPESVVRCTTPW
jgi:hypothetical protein